MYYYSTDALDCIHRLLIIKLIRPNGNNLIIYNVNFATHLSKLTLVGKILHFCRDGPKHHQNDVTGPCSLCEFVGVIFTKLQNQLCIDLSRLGGCGGCAVQEVTENVIIINNNINCTHAICTFVCMHMMYFFTFMSGINIFVSICFIQMCLINSISICRQCII